MHHLHLYSMAGVNDKEYGEQVRFLYMSSASDDAVRRGLRRRNAMHDGMHARNESIMACIDNPRKPLVKSIDVTV